MITPAAKTIPQENYPMRTVSAITGVNPETAKSRLRYALGKLRSSLAATHEETGS